MTDFLHSVVGELGDKVAQSEVEDMESKLTSASEEDEKNDQTSVLKKILDLVPWDMLEDDQKPDAGKADDLKQASAAKAEEVKQNPLDPNATLGGVNIEQAKATAEQTLKDMYPILEFHDQVMKATSKIMSKVPGLDEVTENIAGALQIYIFSILAPYVKPVIAQARVELKSSSEGVLKSSEKGQYEVFENESSTDPTHSMLSKDHFSNVLNPVAGQIACATLKFVVPHIVDSWSDEGKDVRQTIDDILQVFHHPALRDENKQGQKAMYETVKSWWEGKNDEEKENLKNILSFDGVKDGKNHDTSIDEGGHGGHSHGAPTKKKNEGGFIPSAQEGASVIDGLVGGLTNIAMKESGLGQKIGYTPSSGRQENSNSRQDGNESSNQGYGRQSQNQQGSQGRNEESTYGQETSSYGGGNNESSSYGRQEESSSYGGGNNESSSYGRQEETSSYGGGNNESSSYGRGNTENESSSYGRNESSNYGNSGSRNDDNESSGRRGGNSYGQEQDSNENESSSYGRGNDNETSSYGRENTESSSYGQGGGYGGSRNEEDENERGNRRGGNKYGGESTEDSSYGRGESRY
jgi:hypothetical protein